MAATKIPAKKTSAGTTVGDAAMELGVSPQKLRAVMGRDGIEAAERDGKKFLSRGQVRDLKARLRAEVRSSPKGRAAGRAG